MMLAPLIALMLAAPLGPSLGLSHGSSGGLSPVAGSVSFDSFGQESYGPDIPAPTIDCVASPTLPSATWTSACSGTCPGGANITLAGTPGAVGVLSLRIQGRVTGPPAKLILEPTWTPTGGTPQTAPAFDVLLPATSLHLWGSTGLEALRGVYLSAPSGIENYEAADTHTATVGTAPGEMLCNGQRSYAPATANGDQHGSAAVNLTATCANAFPSGLPPYVRAVDSMIGGSGTTLQVSGCNVGTSVLLLSQSVPVNYTNNLTFYGVADASGQALRVARQGSPTTMGSPWWYRGDTATRRAVGLSGSEQYFDLGDVADQAGDFSVCVEYMEPTLGTAGVVTKDDSTNRSWTLAKESGSNLAFRVFGGGSTSVLATMGTVAAGSWNVVCTAYDFVANGSSVLRANFNGTAPTEVTNAVGPVDDTSTTLKIGYDFDSRYLAGSVRRVSVWTGFAASDTQLATMTRSQRGLLAQKPATAEVSFSRADSTLCCPFTDAECYWLAPGVPCIHAPTYSGWAGTGGGLEVYGAGKNDVDRSYPGAGWLTFGGSAHEANSASCPLAPDGLTRGSLIYNMDAQQDGSYWADPAAYEGVQTINRSAWLALPIGATTACNAGLGDANSGCPLSVGNNVTLTNSTWQRVSWTHTGGSQTPSTWVCAGHDNPCTAFCAWGVSTVPGSTTPPYRATDGTAYSGSSATATTASVPFAVTNPQRFAFSVTAQPGNAWNGSGGRMLLATGTGANNTDLRLDGAGNISFTIYDGAASPKYIYRQSPANTTRYRWTLAANVGAGGNHLMLRDDVAQNVANDYGSGSGALGAFPANLYLGSTGSAEYFNGLVARVLQCRRLGGCR